MCAAFDEGFTLLHELLHAIGYEDATSASEVGAVETRLNQAREEIGLPLRAEYFVTPAPTFVTRPTISCPGTHGYTVGMTSCHSLRTWCRSE